VPRARGALLLGALVLLAPVAGLIAALASSESAASVLRPRLLAGTVSPLISRSRELGSVPSAKRIQFAVALKLPNLIMLDQFVSSEYEPGSPNYHTFLTPAQFGARFGAASDEIQRATAALRGLGLSPSAPTANRLFISARGSVAAVQRAFGVRIAAFKSPAGRSFYANTSEIKLPAQLNDIAGVVGLDSGAVPQPAFLPSSRSTAARHAANALPPLRSSPTGTAGGASPCPQAVASGGYTAPMFANAYDFNGLYAKGFHGEGMSAALVEFDDYHDSNVAAVESCYGITTPVTRRLVDGGTGGPPATGEAEDMADITTLLAMDPRLAHLYVYEAPITGGAALLDQGPAELDLFNAFVSDDKAPVLSASWGDCEELQSHAYNQLFSVVAEEAAAQGQQVFEASGDSGAVDCRGSAPPTLGSISVEQEAALPWFTGVGGTDLGLKSTMSGGTHDELTWNDGGAGGGGQSVVWPMPSWQASYLAAVKDKPAGAANVCGAPAGQLCRMVPDIALNADPQSGGAVGTGGPTPPQFFPSDVGSPGYATYCATSNCSFATLLGAPPLPIGAAPPGGAGSWYPIGGTSLATPLAASAAVLWDQEARHAGLGGFGFLNPSLYRIASNSAKYTADFHDITSDTNDAQYDASDCPTGCNPNHLYTAGNGYDMASGLGSIDAAHLGADLVADAGHVDLTPSRLNMYGYLRGRSTTQSVSVTSAYRGSHYKAKSSAHWLHVFPGRFPGKLRWHVNPKGLRTGTHTGTITIIAKHGSRATLSVSYSVGPRAKILLSPASLRFSERAIDSSGNSTTPACGSTTWNDELKDAPQLNGSGDTTPVDKSTLQTLQIANNGPKRSTLHYEVFFHSYTSSWLTQDLDPQANPGGFQTAATAPLVPTSGTVAGHGVAAAVKLASIANTNAVGGYPRMNQGVYKGIIEVRDLADPKVLVTRPVSLVLGDGSGTPTIATSARSFSVKLAPGKSTSVNLVLRDASAVCGYAYSLQATHTWVQINSDLQSGIVAPTPATAAPSASDTGGGNGFTPITLSAAGLKAGVYKAQVIVNSQNAGSSPTKVPIKLTVGSGKSKKHKKHKK